MERDVTLVIYTGNSSRTGYGEANRREIAAVPADELGLIGIAVRSDRKVVDQACCITGTASPAAPSSDVDG
jgi:hypothetical protein